MSENVIIKKRENGLKAKVERLKAKREKEKNINK